MLEGVSDERGESRFSTFSLVVIFILAKKAVLIFLEAPGEQKQIFYISKSYSYEWLRSLSPGGFGGSTIFFINSNSFSGS